MSVKTRRGFSFRGVRSLLCGCLLLPGLSAGCFLSPQVVSQVPEGIGKGNLRGGVAAGGVLYGAGESCREGGESCEVAGASAIEGQAFLDIGLSDTKDLRLRLTGIGGFQYDDIDSFLIGPGFEFKFSFGSAAVLFGMDFLFLVVPGEVDDCESGGSDDGWCLDVGYNGWLDMSLHTGAVFGIGEPGSVRLLLTPRIGVTSNGYMGFTTLAVGLDIPVTERISIRPQIDGGCYFTWEEQEWFCGGGTGVGLVF